MSRGHLFTFSEPLFPYLSDRDKEDCLRRWLWELTDIRGKKAPSSELHSWARQLRVPSIPYSGVLWFLCPPSKISGSSCPLGKQERGGPGLTESLGEEGSKQQGFREFSQVCGVGRVFLGNGQTPSGFHLWALLELALSKLLHWVVPGPIHTHLDRSTELNIPDVGEIFLY